MGRVFYAIVVERHERELEVDPIDRRVTYRRVKAARYSGSGARAASAAPPARTPQARRRGTGWSHEGPADAPERADEGPGGAARVGRAALANRGDPARWRVRPRHDRHRRGAGPGRRADGRRAPRPEAGASVRVARSRRERRVRSSASGRVHRMPRSSSARHAPQALLAFTIEVRRPVKVRRTYPLVVASQPRTIAILRRPGAGVWLVPHSAAISDWAKEEPATRGSCTPARCPSAASHVRRWAWRGRSPTSATTTHEHPDDRAEAQCVVVHVRDTITSALAGHDGCCYESPPQPREEAMSLIRILLGRSEEPPADEGGPWTCPIAGGQRTVTLTRATNGNEPTRRRLSPARAVPPRSRQSRARSPPTSRKGGHI